MDISEKFALVQKYADRGIKIKQSFDDKYVQDVYLNIPKADLAEALDRDGELLGVCCAAISEIRDILAEVAKEGGWIRMDQLIDLVQLMASHDHGLFGIPELYAKIDPEDCRKERIATTDVEKFEDALRIMTDAASCIRAADIFNMPDIQSCYLKSFHAARFFKALETLGNNLDKLHPPTTQAYAVCFKGEIIGRNLNVSLFETEAEAEETAKHFRSSNEDITVRHIEFDKNGIRFLT